MFPFFQADPEVTDNGVRVNSLCPAPVDTPMEKNAAALFKASKYEKFVQQVKKSGMMS